MVFYGLYKLESIAFHGTQERSETTSLFRYNTKILPDGREIKVPNFSAASVRNRMRVSCFLDLMKRLEITSLRKLPTMNHVVMFSGGPRLENSDVSIRLEFLRELFAWLPGMQLFAGTTGFNMVESALRVFPVEALLPDYVRNFSIPKSVTEEFGIDVGSLVETVTEFQFNTKKEMRLLPDEILQKPIADLTEVEKEMYLPMFDDPEQAITVIENPDKKGTTIANMFDIEVLKAGTRMGHLLGIAHNEVLNQQEMLKSCLSASLNYFKNEPYFGGKKSAGMGMVSFEYRPALTDSSLYSKFVEANKDRIRAIVLDPKIFTDYKTILKYKQ